jgi:hypothetical protein
MQVHQSFFVWAQSKVEAASKCDAVDKDLSKMPYYAFIAKKE